MAKSITILTVLMMAIFAFGFNIVKAENLEGYSLSEKEALKSIIQIRAAQTDHHVNSKAHTFAASLRELHSGEKTNGLSFIDEELSTGKKNGYLFRIRVKDESEYQGLQRWRWWSVEAKPAKYGEAGFRSFYCDLSGRIKAEDIGGGWGTSQMKDISETKLAGLFETHPDVSSASSAENAPGQEQSHVEVANAKPKDEKPIIHKKSIEIEEEPLSNFPGYGNNFNGMVEYFDENENRVWIRRPFNRGKGIELQSKNEVQWTIESERFRKKIENTVSLNKTGSMECKFCPKSGNTCGEIDWDRETRTPWRTKIRYYGNPQASLFPADPVLMRELAEVFINNPRPRLTEPWNLLREVFDRYREQGRFRHLIKEGTCNLEDSTVIFEEVPEGEWIVYARLECEDEYWEQIKREFSFIDHYYHFVPRCCDVWIEFANVKAEEHVFKKLIFGSSQGHVIYTAPDYWW